MKGNRMKQHRFGGDLMSRRSRRRSQFRGWEFSFL